MVLVQCLSTNILCNEKTICDIKVVEVEVMERIRHKRMLISSWSDAFEFYHVQIMDPLEVISMEPLELEVDSLNLKFSSLITMTTTQLVMVHIWWQIFF
jgi:hypothetical protein